jgi:FtsP/CotA-like multicopper oxidase with cupredoxin domain
MTGLSREARSRVTRDVMSRRSALGLLLAGTTTVVLSACSDAGRPTGSAEVRAAEARRPASGGSRSYQLRPVPAEVDLGGTVVATWTYGGVLPGAVLRATAGDRLRVTVENQLPEPTSVHWHGPSVRNDVDGVPGVTTPEVATGGTVTYDFVVPTPGTHWLHPHHGLQLDRGLYAPMIIDDPAESGTYDEEVVVVLDDWTDGLGADPAQILEQLRATGGTHGGHGMGGMGGAGTRWTAGDWSHPAHVVNGRLPQDPPVVTVPPGARVRLRVVNAAADTAYRLAVSGQRLTVTHADGYPVRPVDTGSVVLGMGERVDATVTLQDGVTALVAVPEGKTGLARLLLRTSATAEAPPVEHRPGELLSDPLLLSRLDAAEAVRLPQRRPDTVRDVVLSGGMGSYTWTINGRTYEETQPLAVRQGERLRLRVANRSMMAHPLHLHGHTAQVVRPDGSGARKDTVLVPPMGRVGLDVDADNPGQWMLHRHNAYHAESGMMTRLEYRA